MIKTIKRSEATIAFPVKPEYIAKNTANPKRWSIIVFFIVLIGGSITVMIVPSADVWGMVVASVMLPVFIYFMIIYNNASEKRIYVGINDKSIMFYGAIILEVKFNSLKKIELIRDYKEERLIKIKITKNSFGNGGILLNSEMFDLEPILRQLKTLESIPQNIWAEKTIIVKKKYHSVILFSILFLLIIICIFLYLSGKL